MCCCDGRFGAEDVTGALANDESARCICIGWERVKAAFTATLDAIIAVDMYVSESAQGRQDE